MSYAFSNLQGNLNQCILLTFPKQDLLVLTLSLFVLLIANVGCLNAMCGLSQVHIEDEGNEEDVEEEDECFVAPSTLPPQRTKTPWQEKGSSLVVDSIHLSCLCNFIQQTVLSWHETTHTTCSFQGLEPGL